MGLDPQQKCITFVNRHYAPNLNVTGENVWDLAKYLIEEHNIEVHIVHVDKEYTGGGYRREAIGIVHKVKTIYTGDNKYLRNLAGLWDGYFLIRRAKKSGKGPIVVLTSPPLLPMWASMMLKHTWIMWSMDLFPEGFGAIHEMKTDSWIYKFFFRNTYRNAPQKLIALGPGQKANIEAKFGQKIASNILPCGVFITDKVHKTNPAWKTESDKIYFGYCGNCGIPHNPAFVKAAIDHIDPSRHRMILVVYGIYAEEILAYARDKPGIIIMDNVPRHQLGFIDVHLVTLLPSWTHIAVPSKAMSSVCSGSSILFCGNSASDIWQLLQKASWIVEDNEDMYQNLKITMNNITAEDVLYRRQHAEDLTIELNNLVLSTYNEIAMWAK